MVRGAHKGNIVPPRKHPSTARRAQTERAGPATASPRPGMANRWRTALTGGQRHRADFVVLHTSGVSDGLGHPGFRHDERTGESAPITLREESALSQHSAKRDLMARRDSLQPRVDRLSRARFHVQWQRPRRTTTAGHRQPPTRSELRTRWPIARMSQLTLHARPRMAPTSNVLLVLHAIVIMRGARIDTASRRQASSNTAVASPIPDDAPVTRAILVSIVGPFTLLSELLIDINVVLAIGRITSRKRHYSCRRRQGVDDTRSPRIAVWGG
ncbi:hypothetical protein FIV07_06585 [Mycobacterium sp. THAF192]|nr:hypothetical protein FIV07_06585 [Mycobacterium sp. THAF192]